MTIKTYKRGRKIICYISQYLSKYVVSTGKPSDNTGISWTYYNFAEAEKTAEEYFNNMAKKI